MFRGARVAPDVLARSQPPAWAYADVPLVDLSSSAIRARGDNPPFFRGLSSG
jgi:nicotinate-nucleotide adenylyltransferase